MTSEDSDQLAHQRSLIRVFADRISLLQPPGYPKGDKQEPLPYLVDVKADMNLRWSHMSNCKLCHALTQMKREQTKKTCNTNTALERYTVK